MRPRRYTTILVSPAISAGLTPRTSRPFHPLVQNQNVIRAGHTSTPKNPVQRTEPAQAQPLSGYYAELLGVPSPEPAQHSRALPQPKEERARIVFGSRLAGSGYESGTSSTPDSTWPVINGVPIPPRPADPDNCCMSGCAHCVWDDYRDEIEDWAVRARKAEAMATSAGASQGESRSSRETGVQRSGSSDMNSGMDDDGGGGETNWSAENSSALFSDIPVGIRQFMQTEKRLRERRRKEKSAT